jgi:hypothetical protein
LASGRAAAGGREGWLPPNSAGRAVGLEMRRVPTSGRAEALTWLYAAWAVPPLCLAATLLNCAGLVSRADGRDVGGGRAHLGVQILSERGWSACNSKACWLTRFSIRPSEQIGGHLGDLLKDPPTVPLDQK